MVELYYFKALAAHGSQHRVDPQIGRRVARQVLRHGQTLEEALHDLHREVPPAWSAGLNGAGLPLLEQFDSDGDGATKWAFRASNGSRIESVLLRIASGRRSLCLSIQSHCPVGCAFCASGFLGKPRALELADVLGQVIFARQHLRREGAQLRNLVFMGMGEPLLEEALLHRALDLLTDDRGFAFSPSRITVSTVGIPAGMVRLADRFPRLRQALSLHSARPAVRERLIPMAKRHSLDELRQAVLEVGRRTGGQVLVEYLLLQDVNDGPGDEAALAEWLDGLPVKLNLIPYNPPGGNLPDGTVDLSLRPTPRAECEAFADRMRQRGFPTTLRYSLGSEIAAACGQLAGRAGEQAPKLA